MINIHKKKKKKIKLEKPFRVLHIEKALEVGQSHTFDRVFNAIAAFKMAAKRRGSDNVYTQKTDRKKGTTTITRLK